jgi:hypothetical protein
VTVSPEECFRASSNLCLAFVSIRITDSSVELEEAQTAIHNSMLFSTHIGGFYLIAVDS